MSPASQFEKPRGKEHLDKDFLEELKHKIWSTKGTRFNADSRLKSTAKLSHLCMSLLSVYLIIFGLLTVYKIYNPGENPYSANIIAFTITATSILLLVFSQFENSQNYQLKAKNFHDCALDLADLYNELQNFKTYKKDVSDEEKLNFCSALQKRYQAVLRKFENHSPIDNQIFRCQHSDYYNNPSLFEFKIRSIYFLRYQIIYIISMILPGILLFFMIY
ncbi:SLATT domain-containing protein [Marivirga arenosa]|uniref:SLATT domain-containing protein n=1 Tax=Marivirga arenosa TaxID=3059076 RepID=A0AA49GKB2_9BACT|nr:SLATT domain-containing protein [Marivirga sp. ABR2-2]WKK84081.1 SLATT domain-containing protein [Marivirga sp. ABR2-2]